MAKKTSAPASNDRSTPGTGPVSPRTLQPDPPPTVSGRWLIAALALTFLAAGFCTWAALCLLFYQGQWQMLFHPSRTIAATPASAGLAFQDVRFDVTDEGIPRLDAWWIPAAANQASPWAGDTILYLHGSRGSLSACVPALATLHNLGINLFAIDYQGYGRSRGQHPTERLLDDDASAAWRYLTTGRGIPPSHIVVYGDGIGATLAARIAAYRSPAAVVLEDPNLPAREIFDTDARSRILPLSLLQKEFLDPSADLARSHVPRLFLDVHAERARAVSTGPLTPAFRTPAAPAGTTRARQLFEISSSPKQYADLRSARPAALDATLRRFLGEYLH